MWINNIAEGECLNEDDYYKKTEDFQVVKGYKEEEEKSVHKHCLLLCINQNKNECLWDTKSL